VSELATVGTVVGGLTVAAPDPHGGTVTFSLTNDAGGRFAINATTGVVTVAGALDHDTQPSHTITVQASDGVLTSTGAIVINLIDEIDSYWTGTAAANTFTVADVQDWQLDGLGGDDVLTGGVGDDIIIGGAGNDTLAGGGGNDTFLVGAAAGTDSFNGGAGTDTLKFAANNVIISASAITGIEAISSGGFTNVGFAATSGNDTLNFGGMTTTGAITINAGEGNDNITGASGNDIIKGEAGTDTLNGGDGNDILDGGDGNDSLIGGAGDDILLIGEYTGTDGFDGGAGFDEIRASMNGATIFFSSMTGIEKISSGGFSNVIIALQNLLFWDFTNIQLSGIAMISGGIPADTIIGSQGADVIYGGPGADNLKGGLGDDTFLYGVTDPQLRFDTVDGGAGWDKLLANANGTTIELASMTSIEEISTGGFNNVSLVSSTLADTIDLRSVVVTGTFSVINLNGGDDTFYGTAGADVVAGGTGADFIDTGDGDDIIQIGFNPGLDNIRGGNGYDRLVAVETTAQILFSSFQGIEEIQGNNLSDTQIVGTANADLIDMRNIVLSQIRWINGGAGNDTLYGSQGADTLFGAIGDDTIYGAGGNDKISFYQSEGTDAVDGGAGYDTLVAATEYAIIGVSSMTSIEAIAVETASGLSHAGLAFTDNADNFDLSAIAVSGITFIDLKAGNDIFVGSSGADRIIGGAGRDQMTGGSGADVFDFNAVAEIDFDTIVDFLSGTDRIDLSTIDARTNVNDDQAFTLIGTSAFTGVSGQLRYDVSGGVSTVQGDVNGDGLADFYLHVNGVSSLTATDFFL
jgi:Ca2+-binding RTX toxin-like protein